MEYTLSAIKDSDVVFVRSEYDKKTVSEFIDKEVFILTKETFEEKVNELQQKR